jgi:predicted metal-dependent HD superfamily phosphohydrolase
LLKLKEKYSEPHRFYHNLTHIADGFAQHDRFFPSMDMTIFFAWAYHDAIYEPVMNGNEERSAALFLRDRETLGIDFKNADTIVELILSTTYTGATANLITDIDLSSLGAAPEVFDQNTANIRKEYDFVDDATWRAGRIAILQRFLERNPLYVTPEFAHAFEVPARKNLRRAIAKLQHF